MKAIVFDRHGGPEVLELRDLPEPPLGPREARVRVSVRTCGINHEQSSQHEPTRTS